METPVTAPTRHVSLHPDCPDMSKLGPTAGDAILRAEAADVEAENEAERNRFLEMARQEEEQEDRKGVTRRSVLVGGAVTTCALVTSQWVSTKVSFGATNAGTLITLFLYGGHDGLSAVAPMNDPVLQKSRPDFVLPNNGTIPLSRGFGLNRAFMPLKKYLDMGEVTFLHGVSDPRINRSHFDATDVVELGGTGNQAGWMDSLIGIIGPGTAFRGVGMGSTLPRSLVGSNGSLALRSIGDLNFNGDGKYKEATAKAVETLFTGINHPLEGSVKTAIDSIATAQRLSKTEYKPANGAQYNGLGNSFREVARLIKGGAGVRAVTIGYGGFDTHENQGTNGGNLANRYDELSKALAAFFDDLGEARKDVTILVCSEFGRRVAQNGGGTDHGHGGLSIIMSGKKVAGNMLGKWGGLGTLDSGDVPENNNMFDVFGSVAMQQFDLTNAQVQTIFPRRTFAPIKILK